MNLTSSHPSWSINNGLPGTYPSAQQDLRCDAVVIGSGSTGALTACHLGEAGVKPVLIDRREIGTGSISASTALLQYEVDVPLRDLAERLGDAVAAWSYLLSRGTFGKLERLASRLKIQCGIERKLSLFLARRRCEIPELRVECELGRKLGFQLEFFDAAAIREHLPFSRPASLYSQDGGQVDPHLLTHVLLEAGQKRGLEVYDRTKLVHLEETPRGALIATDSGSVIKARCTMIAAGFETRERLKAGVGTLRSTYALISEPSAAISGWLRRRLIWESGSTYLYLRTTAEGRFIVGGKDESLVNAKRRESMISAESRALVKKFARSFSNLKLEASYAWAGTFRATKDGLAYIGVHPRLPHSCFSLRYGRERHHPQPDRRRDHPGSVPRPGKS